MNSITKATAHRKRTRTCTLKSTMSTAAKIKISTLSKRFKQESPSHNSQNIQTYLAHQEPVKLNSYRKRQSTEVKAKMAKMLKLSDKDKKYQKKPEFVKKKKEPMGTLELKYTITKII